MIRATCTLACTLALVAMPQLGHSEVTPAVKLSADASSHEFSRADRLGHQLQRERRRWSHERKRLTRIVRTSPPVSEALTVASIAYGVPRAELEHVAFCESTLNPSARNGRYRGIFQMGPIFESSPYGRAGLSVWSPLASAMAAASIVRAGGWGPWECRP